MAPFYQGIKLLKEPLINARLQRNEINMRAPYGLKHDSYFYYVIKLKINCLINNLSRMNPSSTPVYKRR